MANPVFLNYVGCKYRVLFLNIEMGFPLHGSACCLQELFPVGFYFERNSHSGLRFVKQMFDQTIYKSRTHLLHLRKTILCTGNYTKFSPTNISRPLLLIIYLSGLKLKTKLDLLSLGLPLLLKRSYYRLTLNKDAQCPSVLYTVFRYINSGWMIYYLLVANCGTRNGCSHLPSGGCN